MIDALKLSGKIAASGLETQSMRMRIVSENLANARHPDIRCSKRLSELLAAQAEPAL